MKQKKSFLCRHNRCLNTAKAICVSFLFSIPAGTAVAAVHAAEVDIVQQNETVKGTVLDEQGIPVIWCECQSCWYYCRCYYGS